MKPRTQKKYRAPQYPPKLAVLSRPRLLMEHQPPAWARSRELTAAAALILATGLSAAAGQPDKKAPTTAVVAPLFQHGDGRGALGCVVVAPPSFLSEEEALTIIEEELSAVGLSLTEKDVPFKKVMIPARQEKYLGNGQTRTEDVPGSAKPLLADRRDPDRRVAFEFISHSDYFVLGGVKSASTLQDFDFMDVSSAVADKVQAKGPAGFFGVLYDPITTVNWRDFSAAHDSEECKKKYADPDVAAKECAREYEEAREQERARAREQSQQLLRAQVKDFIEWLKAQGAI